MRAAYALTALLMMTTLASAQDAMERGRRLAEKLCADCHAIADSMVWAGIA